MSRGLGDVYKRQAHILCMEDYCFYHEKSVLANICKYMVIANKRICIFGPKKAVEDEK